MTAYAVEPNYDAAFLPTADELAEQAAKLTGQKRPGAQDRLVGIIAHGLNEYASYMARDLPVPNHWPGWGGSWFYPLAREQASLCRSRKFRKLLTADARAALNAKPSLWRTAKAQDRFAAERAA